MTDALVQAALIGTARRPDPARRSVTPVDALIGAMPAQSVERDILLAAGALAVYRQAGRTAASRCQPPAACEEDPRPELIGAAADVVGDLLHGRTPAGPRDPGSDMDEPLGREEMMVLLRLALRLVHETGRRLPHHLLIKALETTEVPMRNDLIPVLGARGYWLAQFNDSWRWAAIATTPAVRNPEWHGGTAEQRLEALRLMRTASPEMARAWLETSWDSEKERFQIDALKILASSLSATDEPFLERLLDDQDGRTRRTAADLLRALPGSALSARLLAAADACLSYAQPAGKLQGLARSLGEGRDRGTLSVLEQDLSCNGTARSPRGLFDALKVSPAFIGQAQYVDALLSLIPPSHWSERFGATAEDLIAAAGADEEWGQIVLGSWARVAAHYAETAWSVPLWRWWIDVLESCHEKPRPFDPTWSLFGVLPEESRDAEFKRLISDDNPHAIRIALTLPLITPNPWTACVGHAYCDMLLRHVERLPRHADTSAEAWVAAVFSSIRIAAVRLPPECWHRIPASWNLPDVAMRPWHVTLAEMSEFIRVRRLIQQALVP